MEIMKVWKKYTDVYSTLKGAYWQDGRIAIPGIRRGMKVRIPEGVYIKSCGSSGDYISKRATTITVKSFHPGIEGNFKPGDYNYMPSEDPTVVWAGSKGYRCEADVNDIEISVEE